MNRYLLQRAISKKIVLSIIVAMCGVLWLNLWHKMDHGDLLIAGSSRAVSWLRDSALVLLPILVVIIFGSALFEWLGRRFDGRMSTLAQSSLLVLALGMATSAMFVLVESNRVFRSNIGNEFSVVLSLCRSDHSAGIPFLGTLLRAFSINAITWGYVVFRDWACLTWELFHCS